MPNTNEVKRVKKKRELSAFEKKLTDLTIKFTPISFTQKLFFVDHLRTMVSAGLSLVESLGILSRETANKRFKGIIGQIKNDVEKGEQFSEVLAKHPKVFPSIYVQMIASGEVSGQLETVLEQITEQMKKTRELLSSIRGALIYPAVILVAMAGIGILMATVVLPKILELFKDFDAELPLATQILIVVIDFVSKPLNLVLILILTISFFIGFIYLLKKSLDFKKFIHNINLHIPIIGPVIKKINLAKFSMTLSSLLKSTIPIITAVGITAETCGNVLYQDTLKMAAESIKKGDPLSQILHENEKLFPPMVTEMIMVGERTGEIEKLLNELAEFYGDEVDKTMKNFATIIEPIIILVLGVAVAGIAVAVVMPMYSLVQSF
ncbi:type II secretion system F family protein [Patescibacteria group bacterium]|nr:type II secretion system F family protein [Patescibacteria group bacterium]MBU1895321.1 type II secretion system F family protein [Patescibacteria group bacterium]